MRKLSLFILFFCFIAFSCQETENETSQNEVSRVKLNSFRQIFKEGFENASNIIQDDDFSQNTVGTRYLSVKKNYVKLTKAQYQGFGDLMRIMYSSESLDQYIQSVIEYLSYVEQSDIEPSDKLFAYTIGAISIESGIYSDKAKSIANITNLSNARTLCSGNSNSTWSWRDFAIEITKNAVTGGFIGAGVGGTASLGVLTVPSWVSGAVAGGLIGGMGYAINDVFKSAESTGSNCCNSNATGSGSGSRPSSFSKGGRDIEGRPSPIYEYKESASSLISNCPLEREDRLFIEDLKENWEPNPITEEISLMNYK